MLCSQLRVKVPSSLENVYKLLNILSRGWFVVPDIICCCWQEEEKFGGQVVGEQQQQQQKKKERKTGRELVEEVKSGCVRP